MIGLLPIPAVDEPGLRICAPGASASIVQPKHRTEDLTPVFGCSDALSIIQIVAVRVGARMEIWLENLRNGADAAISRPSEPRS